MINHQQTGTDDYDIRRGCVGMCDPGAGETHEGRHHRRRRGIGPSSSMRPSGSATISPSKGMFRRTRHQERWLAVGTHYGPTRIYGPTGHAIGGTAQLALRSPSAAAIILLNRIGSVFKPIEDDTPEEESLQASLSAQVRKNEYRGTQGKDLGGPNQSQIQGPTVQNLSPIRSS